MNILICVIEWEHWVSDMRKKLKTDNYNLPLTRSVMFDNAVKGDAEIGIEIEVEGRNLPRTGLKGWVIHEDGSLRGESAEYVFRNPVNREQYPYILKNLQDSLASANAVVNESYRTSVHVHVNARDMFVKDIYTQILLYALFDDALAPFYGHDRKGNLFCLRARDAGYLMDTLRRAVLEDRITYLNTNEIRYTQLNPVSLFRHGSLEYRAMRGTVDMDKIAEWVQILLAMKDSAIGLNNPTHMINTLNGIGVDEFARNIFGAHVDRFEKGWQDSVMSVVDQVEHIAHACAWLSKEELAKKPEKKPELYTKRAVDPGLRPPPEGFRQAPDFRNIAVEAARINQFILRNNEVVRADDFWNEHGADEEL